MKVFVTGATGFIGSAIVPELTNAGHQVLGMARSDASAASILAAGGKVHRADLNDLESLRSGASASDAVIHTAFIHDFLKFQENCAIDKRAIEALGSALAGSERPLIVTSGIATMAEGRPSTEEDAPSPAFPRVSEITAERFLDRGVRVSIVRLPQVHDTRKQGLVTSTIALALQKGVSAYVGEGLNRWAAVHVLDAARVYKLALEKQEAGARYHAVAEEGVPMRDIAETIGRGLHLPVVSKSPEDAAAHFGWLAMFAGRDLTGSSALTQHRLGWRPTGPGLLADLERMNYETDTVIASAAHRA
ncbi:MAG TPA: SDR family oxidoreductase [Candidatus Acidoferrum sp.]|nr:SDR family oxidoreductase [Candidatus Acidoferrum sp.]